MDKQKKTYSKPALTDWIVFADDNFLCNPNPTSSPLPSNPDTPAVGVKAQEWEENEGFWDSSFTD